MTTEPRREDLAQPTCQDCLCPIEDGQRLRGPDETLLDRHHSIHACVRALGRAAAAVHAPPTPVPSPGDDGDLSPSEVGEFAIEQSDRADLAEIDACQRGRTIHRLQSRLRRRRRQVRHLRVALAPWRRLGMRQGIERLLDHIVGLYLQGRLPDPYSGMLDDVAGLRKAMLALPPVPEMVALARHRRPKPRRFA